MVVQRPLVLISGEYSELPPTDTPADVSAGVYAAGSGLNGGGSFSSATTISVSLAPAASGLIFVGTGSSAKLADDGSAKRLADRALASGVYALETSAAATSSGTISNQIAQQAIASGSAAIDIINTIPRGTFVNYVAGATVASGNIVGLNQINCVEPIRLARNDTSASGVSFLTVGSGTNNSYSDIIYASGIDRVVTTQLMSRGLGYGFVQVFTISGSTLTHFQPNQISATTCSYPTLDYNYKDNVFLCAYAGVSNYLNVRPFTLNTTTNQITAGTNVITNSIASTWIRTSYNPDQNNFLTTYVQSSAFAYAQNFAVSGTTVTAGSGILLDTAGDSYLYHAYSTGDQKAVACYNTNSNPLSATAVKVIVSSGLNLYAPGARKILSSNRWGNVANTYYQNIACNPRDRNFLATFSDGTTNTVSLIGLTISGADLIAGPEKLINYYRPYPALTYNNITNSYFWSSTYNNVSGILTGVQLDKDLNVVLGTQENWSSYATPSGFLTNTLYNVLSCDATRGNIFNFCTISTANPYVAASGFLGVFTPRDMTLPLNSNLSNQVLGVATTSAASGSVVSVRLPGSIDGSFNNLSVGSVYYVNPTTSGLTVSGTKPVTWSGAWEPIGVAVSSGALLLTESL